MVLRDLPYEIQCEIVSYLPKRILAILLDDIPPDHVLNAPVASTIYRHVRVGVFYSANDGLEDPNTLKEISIDELEKCAKGVYQARIHTLGVAYIEDEKDYSQLTRTLKSYPLFFKKIPNIRLFFNQGHYLAESVKKFPRIFGDNLSQLDAHFDDIEFLELPKSLVSLRIIIDVDDDFEEEEHVSLRFPKTLKKLILTGLWYDNWASNQLLPPNLEVLKASGLTKFWEHYPLTIHTIEYANGYITSFADFNLPDHLVELNLVGFGASGSPFVNASWPSNLKSLNLYRTPLMDFEGVKFPEMLESLNLHDTGIDCLKSAVFPKLLRSLILSDNWIRDLSGITFPNLRFLCLDRCLLKSVSTIAFPDSLETLEMRAIKVKDWEKATLPLKLKVLKIFLRDTNINLPPQLEELEVIYKRKTFLKAGLTLPPLLRKLIVKKERYFHYSWGREELLQNETT